MAMTEALVQRAEAATALDGIGDRLSQAVGKVMHRAPLSNAVGGTWLGHPLHPVLTDLPIGFWTSAFLLDIVGGRQGRRSAQLLVGLGVASAVPTAVAGLADWADTSGGTRRVGSVHAILNGLGLATFALSWRARRRGQHGLGVLWCFVGSAAATAAAALGGELVYRRGTGVDTNAFDPGPQDWTKASIVAPLDGVEGVLLEAEGVEVLAVERRADGADGSDERRLGRDRSPLQPSGRSAAGRDVPRRLRRLPLAPQRVPARRRFGRPRPGHHAAAGLRGPRDVDGAAPAATPQGPDLTLLSD